MIPALTLRSTRLLATLVIATVGVAAPLQADDAPAAPNVTMHLVDQSTWVDPDGEIEVSVALDGDVPPDATVEMTVHEQVTSRVDLWRTFELERPNGLGGRLPHEPSVVPVRGPGTITTRIPIRSGPQDPETAPRLGMANPGVYPVDVTLLDATGARLVSLVTHIVRPPLEVEDPELTVVLVQRLDAEPSLTPDGRRSVPRSARTDWTLATSALASGPDVPVVLSLRPETVDALGEGGSLDRELLDEIAELADRGELAQTSYVATDLDALVRADLTEDLHDQVDLGETVLTRRLGVPPRHDLWVAADDLTPRGVDWLAGRGISRLILPEEALEPSTDEEESAGRVLPTEMVTAPVLVEGSRSGRVTTLVADSLLHSHLGGTGDAVLDARRIAAELAWAWFAEPGDRRATVVMLATDTDPELAEELQRALGASPLLGTSTASEAFGATPLAVETDPDTGTTAPVVRSLATTSSDTDLAQLRSDLNLARSSIASFRTVFPAATTLADEFDARLSVLVSSRLDQLDRSAYLLDIAGEMDDRLAMISLPDRRAITLPARDGTIPLTLTNGTDVPATVAIWLDSEKLDFPEGDRVTVEVAPGTSTLEVEVQARASGAFPLDVAVESPDGRIELGTARYTIRSTAVSGLGLALSAAAIAVLGLWWVRTARRARALRRDQQE